MLLLYCRVDLYCARSAEINPEEDIVVSPSPLPYYQSVLFSRQEGACKYWFIHGCLESEEEVTYYCGTGIYVCFYFFLQYSRWLNHASFWHTDITSVKIACTLFLFLSTILLTSSFFLSVLAWSIAPQGCRPPLDHWHCFTELQLGDQGAVSTWPWNSFSGCCYFVNFFVLLVIFAAVFTSPQTSMIVNCPDPSTDWQRCFASALQGGGGGELCQRQRGRTMFGQSNPSSSRLSWGRKDISWDWLPEYTALVCFILHK